MKRSELYEKVWSIPIIKLARGLGISDVGLAKVCHRHAVPIPPRGYWARLKAGQTPHISPLPNPDLDDDVHFAAIDPMMRERQQSEHRQHAESMKNLVSNAVSLPSIVFAADLAGAHPLVKATQKYCERLPKLIERYERVGLLGWSSIKPEDHPAPQQHGRFNLIYQGCLDINASLLSMDWILRFHATFIRAITTSGMTVVRIEQNKNRGTGQTERPHILLQYKGESLSFKFSQGYRRVQLSAAEWAEKKQRNSWANEFEMRPSGNMTFQIAGSEYQCSRSWQGSTDKLESSLDEIVHAAFEMALIQPQKRKEREAKEIEARHAEEHRRQERRRRDARAEQLNLAYVMMDAHARRRQLEEFLKHVESRAPLLEAPLDKRLAIWLTVIREELSAADPVDEILSKCLSVPTWDSWPPPWWPVAINPESKEGEQ